MFQSAVFMLAEYGLIQKAALLVGVLHGQFLA
jgi:hypothetical protein